MAVLILPYVLLYTKTQSLLFINSHHSPLIDLIMYHITRLPELAYIVFVVILGLFAEKRTLFSILLTISLCGILIVLFKNFIFPEFDRPLKWLTEKHISFHHVSGIHLHTNGSFPSGHTIAAFATLSLIGFISKNGIVQFLLFIIACLSGYSRIYAAQHYLMDVYAGALIGFFLATMCYHIFQAGFKTPFWIQPVIRLKK